MATLAIQKINVTLPGNVSKFLSKKAKKNNMSLPETILAIVMDTMEDEEDEISSEEEKYLLERVEKNEAESTKLYTHEEVMARFR